LGRGGGEARDAQMDGGYWLAPLEAAAADRWAFERGGRLRLPSAASRGGRSTSKRTSRTSSRRRGGAGDRAARRLLSARRQPYRASRKWRSVFAPSSPTLNVKTFGMSIGGPWDVRKRRRQTDDTEAADVALAARRAHRTWYPDRRGDRDAGDRLAARVAGSSGAGCLSWAGPPTFGGCARTRDGAVFVPRSRFLFGALPPGRRRSFPLRDLFSSS
jgi:hypothetical protein